MAVVGTARSLLMRVAATRASSTMAPANGKFYDLQATDIDGQATSFSKYKGKVVLIQNTATLCGTTTRDFTQMNLLISRFGPEKLAVLAFPCNQFGHQENTAGSEEIKSLLRHVRPGNNFEPACDMFSKVEVNGAGAHPVFKYLKSELPLPADDPTSLMGDAKFIIWTPVQRSDIAWNFEKFLIGPDGKPFRRYSKKYETIQIEEDIKNLLNQRGK